LNPVVLPELRFRHLWFGAGVAIAVLVAVACLAPGRKLPDVGGLPDKAQHLLAFTMLAFWFGSILVRRDLVWMALALVVFGGLIEVAQELMRWGRDGEVLDLLADTGGILFGILLALTPLGRWAGWVERRLAGKPA
jgi:VanZ family protein